MSHGAVAAVNLHIAGQAALFMSLEASAWTDLQSMVLDAKWCHNLRCEGSKLQLALCGVEAGSISESHIRATDLSQAKCVWSPGGPERWSRALGLAK